MLVWVENASTLESKSEEEIIEFVDQYLTCSSDNEKKNKSCEPPKSQTF